MRISRLTGFVAVVALLGAAFGCDDTTQPPPPPQPPQIAHGIYYLKANEMQGGKIVQTGLQNNDVFAILVASNGKLWIGNQDGVAVYPNLNTTRREAAYDHLNGLPNPKVRALAEHNGKIYVGTWGGGVGVYDIAGDSWTQLRVTDGLANGLVGDIAVAADKIYFATNNGVSIYDPAADSWDTYNVKDDGLLDPLVSAVCIAEPSRGREAWYGPRVEFGLSESEYDEHGITVARESLANPIYYKTTNSALLEPDVNDIFYDDATDLFWVGYSGEGLSSVDVEQSAWTHYDITDGLPSMTVYSITKVDGTVWVATQNGIARQLGNGSWRSYGLSGGLKSNSVRLVYSDDGQRLFVGYIAAGAGRVNPASAE